MSTIFNKIIKREIPAKIIYEDDDVIAFLDIAQNTKGHTLVIPKESTTSILTASEDVVTKVNLVAQKLAIDLVKIFDAKGVNILTNANEVAGQTVFHYHVHVIPRYTEDELKFKTSNTNFDLDEIYNEILSHIKQTH